MSNAAAIYNYERTLARELSKLHRDEVNGKVLLKYYRTRVAEGISQARIIKCLWTLRKLSKLLNKPFDEAEKDDLVNLVAKIEETKLSAWTKRDYKIILKGFYKWLRDTEDAPLEVKWIKAKSKVSNNLVKEKLLTTDEVKKLVQAANHIRDKALILVVSETGRRIGEILSLKIGDVEFDQYGARLVIDGKTGPDLSRVVASASKLATWLDIHPLRDDPNAPVWIGLGNSNNLKQLSYSAARTMLNECAKRAGLRKRVYFHLFRHSRATQASTMLTQAQMNHMFGWKQGSTMPSVYVHLAGKELDDAMFILNDIKERSSTEPRFKPRVCLRCEEKNSPESKFCNRCGTPLDIQGVMKIDETRKKLDQLLDKLTADPQKLDKFMSLIKEI